MGRLVYLPLVARSLLFLSFIFLLNLFFTCVCGLYSCPWDEAGTQEFIVVVFTTCRLIVRRLLTQWGVTFVLLLLWNLSLSVSLSLRCLLLQSCIITYGLD